MMGAEGRKSVLKGHKKGSGYDFASLEKEYLASNISLRRLAAERNVPFGTLYDHAKKGDWEIRRKARIKKKAKQAIKQEAQEQKTEFETWEELQTTIRNALADQWRKVLADDELHLSAVAALTKATKDAREMGIFGITVDEIKKQKEVDKLSQEIESIDTANNTEIVINGGGEYGS